MADQKENEKETFPEPNPSTTDYGAVLASWEFSEHELHQRSRRWYLLMTLVVLLLLIFSYYDNNPLFGVIIILSLIAFAISEYRGPDRHTFSITDEGLVINGVFYAYDEIHNFFILYQPPQVKMLYFDPKSTTRPLTGVPLEDNNPNDIRRILLEYLPEDVEREGEPTSDFLGRLFKF